MKAIWQGVVVAESDDTVVVEGNHYFPESALKAEYTAFSNHRTSCPWKGQAHYKSLLVNGEMNPDAVWYYPEPSEAAQRDQGPRRLLERRQGRVTHPACGRTGGTGGGRWVAGDGPTDSARPHLRRSGDPGRACVVVCAGLACAAPGLAGLAGARVPGQRQLSTWRWWARACSARRCTCSRPIPVALLAVAAIVLITAGVIAYVGTRAAAGAPTQRRVDRRGAGVDRARLGGRDQPRLGLSRDGGVRGWLGVAVRAGDVRRAAQRPRLRRARAAGVPAVGGHRAGWLGARRSLLATAGGLAVLGARRHAAHHRSAASAAAGGAGAGRARAGPGATARGARFPGERGDAAHRRAARKHRRPGELQPQRVARPAHAARRHRRRGAARARGSWPRATRSRRAACST